MQFSTTFDILTTLFECVNCTVELKSLDQYNSKCWSAGVDSKASVTINALWPKPRAQRRLRARPHCRMRLLGRRKKTQRLYWPYSGQTAKLQPEEKQSNSPRYKQSLLKCSEIHSSEDKITCSLTRGRKFASGRQWLSFIVNIFKDKVKKRVYCYQH